MGLKVVACRHLLLYSILDNLSYTELSVIPDTYFQSNCNSILSSPFRFSIQEMYHKFLEIILGLKHKAAHSTYGHIVLLLEPFSLYHMQFFRKERHLRSMEMSSCVRWAVKYCWSMGILTSLIRRSCCSWATDHLWSTCSIQNHRSSITLSSSSIHT